MRSLGHTGRTQGAETYNASGGMEIQRYKDTEILRYRDVLNGGRGSKNLRRQQRYQYTVIRRYRNMTGAPRPAPRAPRPAPRAQGATRGPLRQIRDATNTNCSTASDETIGLVRRRAENAICICAFCRGKTGCGSHACRGGRLYARTEQL